MSETAPRSPDVLIVGAGPTGLSLAITCRRFGLPVRVIDRAETPTTVSKALAVWSGSLEAIAAMGAIDGFLGEGTRLEHMRVGFSSRSLAVLPVGEGVDSPYPYAILIPQRRTEALLGARLAELGGGVERGLELTGLTQDDDGVTATLSLADGSAETVRTRWLVGCDGARSAVRRALGIDFEGYTETDTYLLCDAAIDGPVDPKSAYVWWSADGTIALFPVEAGVWRVFATRRNVEDTTTPSLEEIQSHLDRHGPGGLRLRDPSWLSAFRINERLAAGYRRGRCFIAGDAAHIHSPAGGQGMNTGVQDAVNLGWKLALAAQGAAGAGLLLDSYEPERRPVAEEVVRGAAQKLRLSQASGVLQRLGRAALVSIVGRVPAAQRRLQVELSETEVAYRDGPLVALGREGSGRGKPAVGERADDAPLSGEGPSSLWPILCAPCHTLLLFGDGDWQDAARAAAAPAGDRIRAVPIGAGRDPDKAAARRYDLAGGGWVLVRPDHVVAARGGPRDTASLAAYAERVLSPA